MSASAIVLVRPHSLIGRVIDRATGSRGWSHCFVDPDWTLRGDPIVIDVSFARGVEFARWSAVVPDGVETLRIELDDATARYFLDRVRRCLGRRYDFKAMALQPLQRVRGTYCSMVVAECLPPSWRRDLPVLPCPSDLAALQRRDRRWSC